MEALRVPRVLPRLHLEPVLRAPLELDEAVAVAVAPLVDPGERGERRLLELVRERRVVRPAPHLREQDEEERRRVGGAVVAGEPVDRRLPAAHLVDDLARARRRCDGSSLVRLEVASARSAVRASSGPKISVCRQVIIVSRPNTVMNHGMPAAGSFPMSPSARMRSAARSLTERLNAWPSVSQLAFTCGTRRCHAASESRTCASSSPKRGPAVASARAALPSSTSTTSSQRSRLASSTSQTTREPFVRPGSEKSTSVQSSPSAKVSEPSPFHVAGCGRRQRLRVLGVAEREVVLLDREDVREVAAELEPDLEAQRAPSTRSGSRSAPAASRRRSASARSRARPAAARRAGCGGRRRPRSTRPGPTRAAAGAGR